MCMHLSFDIFEELQITKWIILSENLKLDLKKEENNEFTDFMKSRFGSQLKTNQEVTIN